MVLEDIAVTGSMDEVIRLDALAAIDAIPVAYRAELGRDIRSSHFWAERPYVLFGATTRLNKAVQRLFGEYVSLRHQQQAELLPERLDTITIGVLLTPRHDGSRPWDTTVAGTRGDHGIDPKYRAALEMLWGPLGTSGGEPDWDGVLSAFREAGAL